MTRPQILGLTDSTNRQTPVVHILLLRWLLVALKMTRLISKMPKLRKITVSCSQIYYNFILILSGSL